MCPNVTGLIQSALFGAREFPSRARNTRAGASVLEENAS